MSILFGLALIADGVFTGFGFTKTTFILLYAMWTGASKWIK